MILKTQDLAKNINQCKIFLFHGVNEGFKEEIIKNTFETIYENNLFKYYEKEVISNLENFYNDILSESFFEKKKLIIIKDATDKIKNEIEILSEKILGDIKIILISGILDKKSKLRNLFEKQKNLISVAFYSDNNLTLTSFAKDFFSKKNISISQESINLIINRSNGDRKNLSNELEKIHSYLADKKKITVEEIESLVKNLRDTKTKSTNNYLSPFINQAAEIFKIITNKTKKNEIFYQKHMTHHIIKNTRLDWLNKGHNCFLIRHPAKVINSYIKKNLLMNIDDVGFKKQYEIFNKLKKNKIKFTVINADTILKDPEKTI